MPDNGILSSRMFGQLIDSVADGFSVLDDVGRHVLVNDELCRVTGLARDELIGLRPPPAAAAGRLADALNPMNPFRPIAV